MMSVKNLTKMAACIGFMTFITGCADQTYKMIGRECPQVTKYEPPYSLIKRYLHSVTLYEGYETRAHFDVLIMSEAMRSVEAALHSAKIGHTAQEKAAYLKKQRAMAHDTIELYVLSQIAGAPLHDKNSNWALYLTTQNGKILKPFYIKEVELSAEIKSLFGFRYINFKAAHLLKFPAHDMSGRRFISPGDTATITFAGTGMNSDLMWTEAEPSDLAGARLKQQDDKGVWEVVKNLSKPKERDEDYYFC